MAVNKHARLEAAFNRFEVHESGAAVSNRGNGKLKRIHVSDRGKRYLRFYVGNEQVAIGLADLVIRQNCGRYNCDYLHAYHINEDHSDNRIENLFLKPVLKYKGQRNDQN